MSDGNIDYTELNYDNALENYDDEIVNFAIKSFIEESYHELKEKIPEAYQKKDYKEIKAQVHKFKTSSRYIGADNFSELCNIIQHCVDLGKGDNTDFDNWYTTFMTNWDKLYTVCKEKAKSLKLINDDDEEDEEEEQHQQQQQQQEQLWNSNTSANKKIEYGFSNDNDSNNDIQNWQGKDSGNIHNQICTETKSLRGGLKTKQFKNEKYSNEDSGPNPNSVNVNEKHLLNMNNTTNTSNLDKYNSTHLINYREALDKYEEPIVNSIILSFIKQDYQHWKKSFEKALEANDINGFISLIHTLNKKCKYFCAKTLIEKTSFMEDFLLLSTNVQWNKNDDIINILKSLDILYIELKCLNIVENRSKEINSYSFNQGLNSITSPNLQITHSWLIPKSKNHYLHNYCSDNSIQNYKEFSNKNVDQQTNDTNDKGSLNCTNSKKDLFENLQCSTANISKRNIFNNRTLKLREYDNVINRNNNNIISKYKKRLFQIDIKQIQLGNTAIKKDNAIPIALELAPIYNSFKTIIEQKDIESLWWIVIRVKEIAKKYCFNNWQSIIDEWIEIIKNEKNFDNWNASFNDINEVLNTMKQEIEKEYNESTNHKVKRNTKNSDAINEDDKGSPNSSLLKNDDDILQEWRPLCVNCFFRSNLGNEEFEKQIKLLSHDDKKEKNNYNKHISKPIKNINSFIDCSYPFKEESFPCNIV